MPILCKGCQGNVGEAMGEYCGECTAYLAWAVSVSRHASEAGIHRVLSDRWTWMKAQKHPANMDMNHEMRKAFHKWALEEFAKETDAQERLSHKRERRFVLSRFYLEKKRRAGSKQMWDLLSYAGRVTEGDVRSLAVWTEGMQSART